MTNTHLNELIYRFRKVYKKLPAVEKTLAVCVVDGETRSWDWVASNIDNTEKALLNLEKLDII